LKKLIFLLVVIGLSFFGGLSFKGCEGKKGTFLKTYQSKCSVEEGVDRLQRLLEENNLSLFHVTNHAQNAKNSEMELLPESVVAFGNPRLDTILMKCNPSIGMDLPWRMVFYTDYAGKHWVSYTNAEYFSLKHNIKDRECLDIINRANIAMEALAVATADYKAPETNTTQEQNDADK